jgi:hypothetical protein
LGGSHAGWLLAGCSSSGALAVWDIDRGQLLVAAFPCLSGMSHLLPLPRAPLQAAAAPGADAADTALGPGQQGEAHLPLIMLARVAASGGEGGGEQGPGAQGGLAPVVLHGGGAWLAEPLALRMEVSAAAVHKSVAAAVSDGGGVVAWNALDGRCLMRGRLPSSAKPGASGGGLNGPLGTTAAAVVELQRACVGFFSERLLMIGTKHGALHMVQV